MTVSDKMTEYQAIFARELPSMLKHHAGKYVVIGGPEPLGFWDEWGTAFDKGVEAYGNVPMLIRQVDRKYLKNRNEDTQALAVAASFA